MTDLLALRNQLSDALAALPLVLSKVPKPPIINFLSPTEQLDGTEDAADNVNSVPGLRAFEANLEKEIDALDKYLKKGSASSNVSSNAPYFLSVWREIQAAASIVAVGQTFPAPSHGASAKEPSGKGKKGAKEDTMSVKVDVVADEGTTWVRVNTIKNSRLRAEFNEMDAYTDSEDDDDDSVDGIEGEAGAHQRPDWRNNSVIRMARSLLAASQAHPIPGASRVPTITFRLTRLCPDEKEPRIAQTIEEVEKMGVRLVMGEREDVPVNREEAVVSAEPVPTRDINLDLSLLVAIVSDITHAPTPASREEAKERYKPLVRRPWKHKSDATSSTPPSGTETPPENSGISIHSRALCNQAEQERQHGLFEELRRRLYTSSPASSEPAACRFSSSAEARDRLSRIMLKIAGPNERRRAEALFSADEDAEERFWRGSRFERGFVRGLIPIRVHEETSVQAETSLTPSPFFAQLESTCRSILDGIQQSTTAEDQPETELPSKAVVQRLKKTTNGNGNAGATSQALTPHTVRSLLLGARTGMTTLTANRTSVKAIVREMKQIRLRNTDVSRTGDAELETQLGALELAEEARTGAPLAALWVVEPRSLAENMRAEAGSNGLQGQEAWDKALSDVTTEDSGDKVAGEGEKVP